MRYDFCDEAAVHSKQSSPVLGRTRQLTLAHQQLVEYADQAKELAVVGRVDGLGRVVDTNGDGVVNINDISAIASNFGLTSPLPCQ